MRSDWIDPWRHHHRQRRAKKCLLLAFLASVCCVTWLLWGTVGCGPIRVVVEPDVAIASQEQETSTEQEQRVTTGGDATVTNETTTTNQQFDQWAPRIDALTRFVEGLKEWSVWLILGIPLASYILPKLVWKLVARQCSKKETGT